jgi:hypothetical protein
MDDLEIAMLKQISTLTKAIDVKDQKMLRKLLMAGKAYSPQEGYVIATTPITTLEEEAKSLSQLSATSKMGGDGCWELRTPKPKHKGDVPVPYEFCAYANYVELPSDVLRVTREVSFMEWIEHNGYKYKRIAGGVMRRPIV